MDCTKTTDGGCAGGPARTPLTDETAQVISNENVGPGLYVIALEAPRIASALTPGQFVHMRIPGMEGHILRRPFSVYSCDAHAGTMDILYQEVGFGSARLAQVPEGSLVDMIGAVGHGWTIPAACDRALLVAGGVGAAPLFMHAQALVNAGVTVDVVLGAQTKDALVTLDRYTRLLGHAPIAATDDGSFGIAGFCTAPAADLLERYSYDQIACCGPEPLMKIVAGMARDAETSCQVSLERRMACGVGACLSCVVDTREGKKRSCVDGPVFDAETVVWS